MSFEIQGKLHKIFETEQKTDSFRAREFVIEIIDGSYPQFIKFQLTQDRCDLMDVFEEGQDIKVHFDLRGREWQGKYFTNLNAWRLEPVGAGSDSPQPGPAEDVFQGNDPFSEESKAEDFDDLPF